MLRFILILVLFLLSLLTVVRAPTNLLWYVAILVTEFSWLFFIAVLIIISLGSSGKRIGSITFLIGAASLIFYLVPIISAYRLDAEVKRMFSKGTTNLASGNTPFSIAKMITGIGSKNVGFSNITYDSANTLALDFYRGVGTGKKPCVIVVHGGSWAGGDSRQLPELNSELAKAGYNVASINYRLAPAFKFPAPVEDVKSAIIYLKKHAERLSIDTANFVLLGRSAGGQVVLSAAYMLQEPSVKGVINFYGPTDMVWGYANPTNPLVLDSRKVMENYLGGTFRQVPQQFINSSPTETASVTAVPSLSIYGENDPLVSHVHGKRLAKKLDQYGIKHYEVYLPWATHGFDWSLNGPAGQLSTYSVIKFLGLITPVKSR